MIYKVQTIIIYCIYGQVDGAMIGNEKPAVNILAKNTNKLIIG